MVFRFEIDGFWYGEFSDRESIHRYLIKEGWYQISPDSNVYGKRVKGITIGTGQVVETLKVRRVSRLPKS